MSSADQSLTVLDSGQFVASHGRNWVYEIPLLIHCPTSLDSGLARRKSWRQKALNFVRFIHCSSVPGRGPLLAVGNRGAGQTSLSVVIDLPTRRRNGWIMIQIEQ